MKKHLRIMAFIVVMASVMCLSLTVNVSASTSICKNVWLDGATEYNGNYYRMIPIYSDWHFAKEYCELIGGHLATVTSEGENNFVFSLVRGVSNTWLGATDEETEGVWKWVTGESFDYKNWKNGEPNNSQNIEHYLHIYPDNEQWNDTTLSGIDPYMVCEWEKEYIAEARNIRVDVDTDFCNQLLLYDGHVYKAYTQAVTWHDAKKLCENAGGHLATIKDSSENTVVLSYANQIYRTSYYLGATDEEGRWKWVTDEPFNYTCWARNQPSGYYQHYLQGCYPIGYLTWDDLENAYRYYICEWEDLSVVGAQYIGGKLHSSNWDADMSQHWHECHVCENVKIISDHKYDENGICVVCKHRNGTKRGFLDEDGVTRYYYKDNEYATRWFNINNKWYYFGASDGAMFIGDSLKISGKTYLFTEDHSALEGFVDTEDGTMFYKQGYPCTGWQDTDGDGVNDAYFYATTSLQCKESRKIGAFYYEYDETTGKLSKYTGFLDTESGLKYYKDGTQVYGWIKPDGTILNGQASVTIKDAYYFAFGDGKDFIQVTEREKTIGGIVREFNEDHTVKAYTGWYTNKTTEAKNYYVDGAIVDGWQEIDGNTYYFSRSITDTRGYGDMVTGWLRIGGKLYRFLTTGALFEGETLKVAGVSYYFNDDHSVFTGLRAEEGGVRFYNAEGVYVTGWADTDGDGARESYFYLSNGYKCQKSGEYPDVNGVKRFYVYNEETDRLTICDGFYNDGVGTKFYIKGIQYTGWVSASGNIVENPGVKTKNAYYFTIGNGIDHYMFVGDSLTYGGIVREFDENHLLKTYTGWMNNPTTGARNYYVNGEKITGWQELDGNTYYFARSAGDSYGDMSTGWMRIGGKLYRFLTTGALFKGELLNIGGTVYYFNADNSVFTGLREEEGGVRFYNSDGVYVTGWADTDGDGARESYFYLSNGYKCRKSGEYPDVNGTKRFYIYNEETDRLTICEGFYNDGVGTKFYVKGVQYTGWVSASGNIIDNPGVKTQNAYYFAINDGVNYYMFEGSERTVGGIVREFDENHLVKAYTGWMNNTVTGNPNYYIKGEIQSGWMLTDEGAYVYLSRSNKLNEGIAYGDVLTGWQKIGGKVYYFRGINSTPMAALITDAEKDLTYNGVRKTYHINQIPSGDEMLPSDYYIVDAPF